MLGKAKCTIIIWPFFNVYPNCRYNRLTKRQLPESVEFFGMRLLGQDSIQGFQDGLQTSIQLAWQYVDVSHNLL